jgi:hypothetical protein
MICLVFSVFVTLKIVPTFSTVVLLVRVYGKQFSIGLERDFLQTPSVGTHFSSFGTLFNYQKGGQTNHLIWLAPTWNIWKLRNQVAFNGVIPNASSLLQDIKSFSWLWFSGRFARNSCIPFTDWCQDPMSFIRSS